MSSLPSSFLVLSQSSQPLTSIAAPSSLPLKSSPLYALLNFYASLVHCDAKSEQYVDLEWPDTELLMRETEASFAGEEEKERKAPTGTTLSLHSSLYSVGSGIFAATRTGKAYDNVPETSSWKSMFSVMTDDSVASELAGVVLKLTIRAHNAARASLPAAVLLRARCKVAAADCWVARGVLAMLPWETAMSLALGRWKEQGSGPGSRSGVVQEHEEEEDVLSFGLLSRCLSEGGRSFWYAVISKDRGVAFQSTVCRWCSTLDFDKLQPHVEEILRAKFLDECCIDLAKSAEKRFIETVKQILTVRETRQADFVRLFRKMYDNVQVSKRIGIALAGRG